MSLKFPGQWRLKPPPDGQFIQRRFPGPALNAVMDLISKVATQGSRQHALEHFKSYFSTAGGLSYAWSSGESWAESDLQHAAETAAENAPLFVEAFYDACCAFSAGDDDVFSPDQHAINELLAEHSVGYVIRPPRLELRGTLTQAVTIPPTLSIAEKAQEVFKESLHRSDQLLGQGRNREAVQESLWLLETATTAFRGTEAGSKRIAGKYFNEIIGELRQADLGTTMKQVLDWTSRLHGYLSSPTGGGVRHGADVNALTTVSEIEARLFCNLIRSYMSFLLATHAELPPS